MIRPISTGESKIKKVVKAAVNTAATAAVVTGSALYLAKTGKLDKFAKSEKAQNAVNGLKGIADEIIAKVKPHTDEAVAKAKPYVDEAVGKVKSSKLYEQGKAFAEKAKPAVTEFAGEVTTKAKKAFETAKNFIQTKITK